MLRDVVHSKNFDDGAVVHRHPLFDSTRETNTTPRRNSSEKKTKRRRTSSSSSPPPSLPFSSLVSLFVVAVVLSSFFRLEKISIYPNPKEEEAKTWAFFVATKSCILSFSEVRGRESKERLSLSLSSSLFFFFFFFLSVLLFLSPSSIKCLSLSLFQVVFLFVLSLLFHPLMRVRSRQKIKKKREYSYI